MSWQISLVLPWYHKIQRRTASPLKSSSVLLKCVWSGSWDCKVINLKQEGGREMSKETSIHLSCHGPSVIQTRTEQGAVSCEIQTWAPSHLLLLIYQNSLGYSVTWLIFSFYLSMPPNVQAKSSFACGTEGSSPSFLINSLSVPNNFSVQTSWEHIICSFVT